MSLRPNAVEIATVIGSMAIITLVVFILTTLAFRLVFGLPMIVVECAANLK